MFVASWGDKVELLGSGGVRKCSRCHNESEHALIDIRKKIKVMFIPVGSVRKGKHLLCSVCPQMTRVTDAEAARLVRDSIQRGLDS